MFLNTTLSSEAFVRDVCVRVSDIYLFIYPIAKILQIKHSVLNRKVVVLSLIITALVLTVNPVSAYRTWQEPFESNTYSPNEQGVFTYSTGIRKSLWQLAIYTIHDGNVFTGYGTGDVKAAMEKSAVQYGQFNVIHSYDPHNQFLYTLIGLGLPGLITLVLCLLYSFWLAYQQNNHLYYAFLALFVLLCLTESALEVQWGITFFAFFNGLFAFTYPRIQEVTTPIRHG